MVEFLKYTETPVLIIVVILLIGACSLIYLKATRQIGIYAAVIITIVTILSIDTTNMIIVENIEHFKHNHTLKCSNNRDNILRISQQTGWKLENDKYFYNDTYMISAFQCDKV